MTGVVSIESLAAEILAGLPASVKSEARGFQAAGEVERWESGYLAADLVDELTSPKYPATAVRLAVALLYNLPESTIRDRERICRRVPRELKAAHSLLTFHLWRACMSTGAGDKSLDYVAQIEAHFETFGRLPRVEEVWGWIAADNDGITRMVWESRLAGVVASLDKLQHDSQLPESIALVVAETLDKLSALIK